METDLGFNFTAAGTTANCEFVKYRITRKFICFLVAWPLMGSNFAICIWSVCYWNFQSKHPPKWRFISINMRLVHFSWRLVLTWTAAVLYWPCTHRLVCHFEIYSVCCVLGRKYEVDQYNYKILQSDLIE